MCMHSLTIYLHYIIYKYLHLYIYSLHYATLPSRCRKIRNNSREMRKPFVKKYCETFFANFPSKVCGGS